MELLAREAVNGMSRNRKCECKKNADCIQGRYITETSRAVRNLSAFRDLRKMTWIGLLRGTLSRWRTLVGVW